VEGVVVLIALALLGLGALYVVALTAPTCPRCGAIDGDCEHTWRNDESI
jgi:hypothetical protein